jgi:quinol monooxygenase YgiN
MTAKEQPMTVRLGVLALLEANPGKASDLGAFLESGRALAAAEPGTVSWYAFRITDTSYGIFDTFETDDARQAHLGGEIPRALAQIGADLLAREPDIRLADVTAVK